MYRIFLGILVALSVPGIVGAERPGPASGAVYHWTIHANGIQGSLDLVTGEGGRITGSLLGRPVEGWLVGRRLVLIRRTSQGSETWEAWLATPENIHGGALPILAGTFLRPHGDGPLPWFGTNEPPRPGASTAPPASLPAGTAPAMAPPSPMSRGEDAPPPPPRQPGMAMGPAASPPPLRSIAPRLPSGQPDLAGTWETPDGPLTIRQEGSKLTFVLPDRDVSGRLTGPDTLIGGFGPGCCKGTLEQGFAVIKWDNGVRWYRR